MKQILAGMAAASFVAIVQLASGSNLNGFHYRAVTLFALVLPLAAMGYFAIEYFDGPKARPYWMLKTFASVTVGLFCWAISWLVFSFGFWQLKILALGTCMASLFFVWAFFPRRRG